jgi:HK97 family phage prohead protease
MSFDLIETKADGAPGEFTAIVAAFGNVDRGGDRIIPGAFTKTIEDWKASGDPLPVILSHDWSNPMSHIGVADPKDMVQVSKGLKIKGKLDVADNPVAAQVYKLMKRRSLKEFSIGYDVPAGGERLSEKDGSNELLTINLIEAGPTLKGMNPNTELLAVKSAIDEASPPATEAELRQRTAALERDEQAARLPDVTTDPGPSPEDKLAEREAEVARKDAELAEQEQRLRQASQILDPKGPTEAELRQQSEQLTREKQSVHLVTGVAIEDPEPEPTPVPEPEPAPEPELRRRAAANERERAKARIPDVTVDPGPDPVDVLTATLETMTSQLKAMQDRLDEMDRPDPPSTQELRKASDALVREGIQADLPQTAEEPSLSLEQVLQAEVATAKAANAHLLRRAGIGKMYAKRLASDTCELMEAAGVAKFGGAGSDVDLDDFDPDAGWAVYCVESDGSPEQMYRVDYTTAADGSINLDSNAVEVTRTVTYRPLNSPMKAEEPVRPADPLRRRSDQTVLAIESDGASQRKYTPVTPDPAPVLPDEADLRRRSKETMLALLTGGTR